VSAERCTPRESCAGMMLALNNPPREGYGIVWQLVIDMRTLAESHMPVYYMRRNQKTGDRVIKILYCPFCGASIDPVPVDAEARDKAVNEIIASAGATS